MFKWLRDTRYADVQAELKILKAQMEGFETNLRSLRGLINQSKYHEKTLQKDDAPSEEGMNEALIEAFGGMVPVELAERYKRTGGY